MKSLKEMASEIVVELEQEMAPEPWPATGTKEWFQRYVQSITTYDRDKPRMPQDQLEETMQALSKFDPKFADLCKKAHDSAIELMDYAQKRMENK